MKAGDEIKITIDRFQELMVYRGKLSAEPILDDNLLTTLSFEWLLKGPEEIPQTGDGLTIQVDRNVVIEFLDDLPDDL